MGIQDGGNLGIADPRSEAGRAAGSRRDWQIARSRIRRSFAALIFALLGAQLRAQTPGEVREDEAVGNSVSYVFATDLGSGVYDLDGRTLQVYRFTWKRELREVRPGRVGARFTLPVTAGFFDFSPFDVISSGPPRRVDSLSLVPGFEFDYLLPDDWHLLPYVRAGFSVASSSVDGWLYGAGVRLERRGEYGQWDGLVRSELACSAVTYRDGAPDDAFVRIRQAVDLTRAAGREVRRHRLEIGLYGVLDFIADPPTAPLAGGREEPWQAELGITLATRPRLSIGRFDAPRLGLGYRLAGDLSGWRVVIGHPF